MTLEKDFEDFVAELNKSGVKYLVVGGYALAFHGKPRHTGDLDIWIAISDSNAEGICKAINNFGVIFGVKKRGFFRTRLNNTDRLPTIKN